MFNWFRKKNKQKPQEGRQITISVSGVDPKTDNEFRFYDFVEREKSWRLEEWYKYIQQQNIPIKKEYISAIKEKIQTENFKNPHNFPEYFNNNFDFIAIDFETANNNRVSACALGIVFIKDFKVAHKIKFKIKPPRSEKFRSFHTQLHGISASDVEFSLTFDAIWKSELSKYLNSNLVICHHHSSDIGCLKKLCEHYKIEDCNVDYIDTEEIAKRCGLPGRLKELTSELTIPFKDNHDPIEDAFACAQVFNELIEKYPNYEELRKTITSTQIEEESKKAQAKTELNNDNLSIIQKYALTDEEIDCLSINGKGFLFTGTMVNSRSFCQNSIQDKGGVVKSGMSKNVDFLVIGEKFGWAKIQKVDDLNTNKSCNIKILSENHFEKLIKRPI